MGHEWMVDLEQEADFVGKEALRRIKEQGTKRRLVGVEIGGEKLGSYNDGTMIDFFPVLANGGEIGRVTSACYSPRLEKNIGYAMVPIEYTELGTELEVETPRERTPAVVVRRPFVDPEKATPRQHLVGDAEEPVGP
jgi:glycine cleavage system aminomethyltransferase T